MSCSSAAASATPVAEVSPKSSGGPKGPGLDLEQHIKKLISENAAIVETYDPLWSKKYVSSRHHSTSCLPSTRPTPYGSSAATLNQQEHNSYNKRRFSEVSFLSTSAGSSRLQSALMGAPQAPDQMSSGSNGSNGSMSPASREPKLRKMSVIMDGKQVIQEHNSNQNNQQTIINSPDAINHQKAPIPNSNSSSSEVSSLVRDLLTSKVPLVTPGKPPLNLRDHPENPERSVIKDLLLKPRDSSSTGGVEAGAVGGRRMGTSGLPSPPGVVKSAGQSEELSMLYYVCTICRIAFRNKETLEAHQLHYCKKGQYPNLMMSESLSVGHMGPHQYKFGHHAGGSPVMIGGSSGGSLAALNNHVKRKISVMEMSPSVILHKTLTEGRPEKHQQQSPSVASVVSKSSLHPPPDVHNTCITTLNHGMMRKTTPPERPSDPTLVMTEDNLRKISNCEEANDEDESQKRKISEDRTSNTSFDSDYDPNQPKRVKIFEGGLKSNEDYTYVRGRGRGKYMCEECGIRCKKPSMLKKHIRTHTDLRPYSCRHCAFAFKTKGNLTKHMKSKAHHKKCVEMGISPVPTAIDESQIDCDALAKQEALERSFGGNLMSDDEDQDASGSDDDDDEDADDEEDEGVPIPLVSTHHSIHDEDMIYRKISSESTDSISGVERRFNGMNMARKVSVVTKSEEQEVAQSLLSLSGNGSWSESNKDGKVHQETSAAAAKRKISILESALSSLSPQNRPRSFSFNDVPIRNHVAPHHLPSYHSPPNTRGTHFPVMASPERPVTHKMSITDGIAPRIIVSPSAKSEQTSSSDREEVAFGKLTISETEPVSDEESDDDNGCSYRKMSISQSGILRWPSPKRSGEDREEPMDLSKRSAGDLLNGSDHFESLEEEDEGLPEEVYEGPQLPQSDFIPIPLHSGAEGGEGKSVCTICSKVFPKPSSLRLHLNIHYFERPYRCEACAVSFRTKGHLQKHKRSVSHFNKVNMNMTFGTPTSDNPRPFKCADCKMGFRIHGHLAKHLRSKLHIMKLECLSKLPFGMYAEMERSGVNLNEIDTTDCENSLISLQALSRRMFSPSGMPHDPSHHQQPHQINNSSLNYAESISDDEDSDPPHPIEPQNNGHHHLDTPAEIRERSISFSGDVRNSDVSKQSLSPSPVPMERRNTMSLEHPTPTESPQGSSGGLLAHASSQSSFATRSNTCHICGQVLKSVKFLQVHLYSEHPDQKSSSSCHNTQQEIVQTS